MSELVELDCGDPRRSVLPPVAKPETSSAAEEPLLSSHLARVLAAELGAATCFYLLATTVPLYVSAGGAGPVGVGLAVGILMGATMLAELGSPWLMTRLAYRSTLAGGLVFLGLSSLALAASPTLATLLLLCAVRGLAFGVTEVAVGALLAHVSPRARRGEGLGIGGAAFAIPGLFALPLSVWVSARFGCTALFIAAGAASLLPLFALRRWRLVEPASSSQRAMRRSLRAPALARPAGLFAVTALGAGAIISFLPLSVPTSQHELAAPALFAQAAAALVTRWWGGRFSDRHGSSGLLRPGALMTALGLSAVALTPSSVGLLGGALLFGAGFGVSQSASLSVMLAGTSPSGYGAVSAMWNLAYDAGLGVGSLGFGLMAEWTGYAAGFAVIAVVTTLAAVAWRSHPSSHATPRARQRPLNWRAREW